MSKLTRAELIDLVRRLVESLGDGGLSRTLCIEAERALRAEEEATVERLHAERDDLLAWSQRFSDLVGVDGSTEAGRDEAFAKLYDAAKASGKLVKK